MCCLACTIMSSTGRSLGHSSRTQISCEYWLELHAAHIKGQLTTARLRYVPRRWMTQNAITLTRQSATTLRIARNKLVHHLSIYSPLRSAFSRVLSILNVCRSWSVDNQPRNRLVVLFFSFLVSFTGIFFSFLFFFFENLEDFIIWNCPVYFDFRSL